MQKRYDRAAAIAAIALGLIVSSCGGGGSSSSSTASLTKVQFITQADRVCEETNKAQLVAVVQASKEARGESLGPNEKQKSMVVAGVSPIKEEAQKLVALGAPKGDEEVVAEIANGIQRGAAAVESAETVGSVGPAFESVNAQAAKYGLKSCAQSP